MSMNIPNVVFLTSGSGGDYFALEKSRKFGFLNYNVKAVISSDENSSCFQDAIIKDYKTCLVSKKGKDKTSFIRDLTSELNKVQWDICVLAGFKYILPPEIVSSNFKKIINSHHSILPANPGLYKKETLITSDNKLLGATVHYVDNGVDSGEKIAQGAFPNFGIENLEVVLKKYRTLQNILIINSFMIATNQIKKIDSCTSFEDIIFWPAIEKDVFKIVKN
ncbi:MAG: hypothetical protein HQK51_06200 [Oligoflexia bacterium]|nr:hypothetical protein [Oligoflexia bacterium]